MNPVLGVYAIGLVVLGMVSVPPVDVVVYKITVSGINCAVRGKR